MCCAASFQPWRFPESSRSFFSVRRQFINTLCVDGRRDSFGKS